MSTRAATSWSKTPSTWLWIADDSVDAAIRITDEILDACHLLVDHPHIGHTRTDLTGTQVRWKTAPITQSEA